jgi:hypothetical protein
LNAETGQPVPGFQHNLSAYNFATAVAADRVDGATFYAYRDDDKSSADGKAEFWVSRDGGLTWRVASRTLPQTNIHDDLAPGNVAAVPGRAGEVWVGNNTGLFRSRDYGATFERVAPFVGNRPSLVAFGKPAPGKAWNEPTIYVYGKREGEAQDGYFFSTDSGASWTTIPRQQTGGLRPRQMNADRQTFGRIYGGSAQQGFVYYAQINASSPTVSRPVPVALRAGEMAAAEVTVGDAETDASALLVTVGEKGKWLAHSRVEAVAGSPSKRRLSLLRSAASKEKKYKSLTVTVSDGSTSGARSATTNWQLK